MRFIENGPSLPDDLLTAQDEGRVIFFCGAGVSIGYSKLPSFSGLASRVLEDLGASDETLAKKLFAISQEVEQKYNVKGFPSADSIFGKLSRTFDTHDVNCAVAAALKPTDEPDLTAHKILLDLARREDEDIRLITTNFDLLFEKANKKKIRSRTRSTLPRLEYSESNWGIVHLHGKVNESYSGPDNDGFVLSSSEFGDAYLANGWARNFVKDILDRYIAVFIGYSADDPPVRYLLEGLQQAHGFKQRVFAFQAADDDEAVAHWDEKGVEAIVYDVVHGRHDALWDTLSKWAERTKNPSRWINAVLRKALRGPATLRPFERGMVAHILKSQSGAKAFSSMQPVIPSEWLCVLDSSIRLRGPEKDWFSGSDEYINLYQRYALDDDPEPSSQNERYKQQPVDLWDAFKTSEKDLTKADQSSLPNFRGLTSNWHGELSLPLRLIHLSSWIASISHEQTAVWWAAQQSSFHASVVRGIESNIIRYKDKFSKNAARKNWETIFEILSDARRDTFSEYHLREYISAFGWNGHTFAKFEKLTAPYLKRATLYHVGPPERKRGNSKELKVRAEVNYPERISDLQIPDPHLKEGVQILRRNLEKAIDLETRFSYSINLCSIEPEIDSFGNNYERDHDISGYVLYFVDLFKRLALLDIKIAREEFSSWRRGPIFTRLRVWACGQSGIASEEEYTNEILALTEKEFWHFRGQRDLLLGMKNNWSRLTITNQIKIERKILRGDKKYKGEDKKAYASRNAFNVLTRMHWLNRHKCKLNTDLAALTKKLSIIATDWKVEFADRAADGNGSYGGVVQTNTDWAVLKNIPLSEILNHAERNRGDDFRKLVEYVPFSGLSKDAPARAIGALNLERKANGFSSTHWETLLNREKPQEDKCRVMFLIGGRLAQLEESNFNQIILTASRWFELTGLIFREKYPNLFIKLWKKFVDALAHELSAAKSALVRQPEEDIDWSSEAINSAAGNLAELLMSDPATKDLPANGGLPLSWRLLADELLAIPSDAQRYAIVIFTFNLSWFFHVDPDWTNKNLLSALNPSTPLENKDAFWAGFMWGAKIPPPALYRFLKPYFLELASTKLSKRKRHTEILSGLILSGWASKDDHGIQFVSNDEMRLCLLEATEEFLTQTLWHLEKWSGDEKAEWASKVVIFLQHVWPKHKRIRTPKISSRLCDLALSSENNFPAVSILVSQLISKVSNEHFFMPQMSRSGKNIASSYPLELLSLLYLALPERAERWPFGTKDALEVIASSKPELFNDPRYVELMGRLNEIGY